MALLHRATITPTKPELLAAWVPLQPWYAGDGDLAVLGAYRFDDPAGEVGIETFLLRAGSGPVLQVPLTYRAAPLEGAGAALVTEMEHSALGRRWVYDALADPVYTATLVTTVLTGGCQAGMEIEVDGVMQQREITTFAQGSGVPGTPVPPLTEVEATVVRVVTDEPAFDTTGAGTLTGRWPDHSTPALLAVVRSR